jgi:alpha-amylase/alpha-mannosidase (GH57 family)
MSTMPRGAKRVDLVLLWHMHQPDYRDHTTGEFQLPWVYLHALKDYTDMAWHLERHPGVHAVVNFAPVLLDQIDDYVDQFDSNRVRDPLLRLLARPDSTPLAPGDREFILDRCFQTNHERVVRPFAAYQALFDIFTEVTRHGPEGHAYLSDQYLRDLLTWYHLGWTGESLRREASLVARLIAKAARFTYADRRALFELIGATLRGIVPRWSGLAARRQVELSTTPEYHPLAPLLLDFATARDALPACPLPGQAYPGGRERVAAHLDAALAAHARRFGAPPAGVWPAEGAVSAEFVALLGSRGLRWTASGAQVLRNSLGHAAEAPAADWLYRPWRLHGPGPQTACFFRDDFLSDRIGFEYAKWNGDAAAADLIGAIERIGAAASDGRTPVVSVILDGENCWEYYPYNGNYFLDALYRGLATHPTIRPTTYADWLDGKPQAHIDAGAPVTAGTLDRLVAGSWVGGDFSTWIGSPERNHAWDLLCAAKARYDLAIASGRLTPEQRDRATRQLAACEASDWFWWLSDRNSAAAVAEIESLFRAHLAHLYALLGEAPPATLDQPVARGGAAPDAGGAMLRASPKAPEAQVSQR